MTTTTAASTTAASNSNGPAAEVNVFEFRKTARRRATICPGSGFDYMGRPMLAILCYATSVATLGLAIGTALNPSRELLLGTIFLVVAGTVLWGYEMFATLTAWPSAEPRRVLFNPWWGAAGICVLLVIFGGAVFQSFKLATFVGTHMSPKVSDDETILFHRLVDDEQLQRGTLILFTLPEENKIDEPGKLTLGRIIAVPGDTISTTKGARYIVNGNERETRQVAPSGSSPIALRVPTIPAKLKVPDGCYFVAQDSLDEGYDSRVLGYAKRDRILSAKMFRFSKSPFLETIE